MNLDDDFGPLFSPGQYDLLTIDKPERQRKPRPEGEIVAMLKLIFIDAPARTLWQVARKLYISIGAEYARSGLDALARLPNWSSAIIKFKVSPMTQVTRIEQAAASSDPIQREMVDIRVEMKRRQALLENADQELVHFLQELHTAHPIMRKQIVASAKMVLQAAFKADVNHAPQLVGAALAEARRNTARIETIKRTYQVPKETAKWLIQILARL